MNWLVYILQCADGSFYTGITNNLSKRITAHERGDGAKYTRGRAPFTVIYQETCGTRGAASKREYEIKSLNREQKLALAKSLVQYQ